MICNICKSKTKKIFNSEILNKYNIEYFKCLNCGLIQTEKPYWLKEAYEEPINISDTGILLRNSNLSEITSIIIYLWLDKNKKFLDFAGGYGVFTRIMRDIGFDFYWNDPYTENIFAKGFEETKNNMNNFELVTAFEVLEHTTNPIEEIESLLSISSNILITTFLTPEKSLPSKEWFYYGFKHGQHITFFSKKTLEYIAKKYNLYLYTNNKNVHLLTKKKLFFFSFRLISNLRRFGFLKYIKKNLTGKITSDSLFLLKKK